MHRFLWIKIELSQACQENFATKHVSPFFPQKQTNKPTSRPINITSKATQKHHNQTKRKPTKQTRKAYIYIYKHQKTKQKQTKKNWKLKKKLSFFSKKPPFPSPFRFFPFPSSSESRRPRDLARGGPGTLRDFLEDLRGTTRGASLAGWWGDCWVVFSFSCFRRSCWVIIVLVVWGVFPFFGMVLRVVFFGRWGGSVGCWGVGGRFFWVFCFFCWVFCGSWLVA